MNRDEKRRFRRVIQTYDRSLRLAQSSFEKEIEGMKEKESTKLENLPESFKSSRLCEELSESVDMLDSLLEKAEEVTAALNEILETAKVNSDFDSTVPKTTITPGKKDARFLALFSSSLLKRLNEESARTGSSMNEIVCRAVTEALSK